MTKSKVAILRTSPRTVLADYHRLMNLAGYQDVQSFVEDMIVSEKNHLKALLMFIRNQPNFFNALKARNYAQIARLYNGPAYATHGYHTRLKSADERNLQYNNL